MHQVQITEHKGSVVLGWWAREARSNELFALSTQASRVASRAPSVGSTAAQSTGDVQSGVTVVIRRVESIWVTVESDRGVLWDVLETASSWTLTLLLAADIGCARSPQRLLKPTRNCNADSLSFVPRPRVMPVCARATVVLACTAPARTLCQLPCSMSLT